MSINSLLVLRDLSLFLATIGKQSFCVYLTVRVECCKKIIKDHLAGDNVPDTAYQNFTMSVYCFPNPDEGRQKMIISSIGFSENQMSEYFIRMTDMEKVQTCRKCVEGAKEMGLGGHCFSFYCLFVGAQLENKVADVLSMKGKTGGPVGTVRT